MKYSDGTASVKTAPLAEVHVIVWVRKPDLVGKPFFIAASRLYAIFGCPEASQDCFISSYCAWLWNWLIFIDTKIKVFTEWKPSSFPGPFPSPSPRWGVGKRPWERERGWVKTGNKYNRRHSQSKAGPIDHELVNKQASRIKSQLIKIC